MFVGPWGAAEGLRAQGVLGAGPRPRSGAAAAPRTVSEQHARVTRSARRVRGAELQTDARVTLGPAARHRESMSGGGLRRRLRSPRALRPRAVSVGVARMRPFASLRRTGTPEGPGPGMRQRPPPQRASHAAASTHPFARRRGGEHAPARRTIGDPRTDERRDPPFADAPSVDLRRGPATIAAREDQRPAPHPVPGPHGAAGPTGPRTISPPRPKTARRLARAWLHMRS